MPVVERDQFDKLAKRFPGWKWQEIHVYMTTGFVPEHLQEKLPKLTEAEQQMVRTLGRKMAELP